MPRRMITSEIWRNEKVASLPDAGRLLFIGIFSSADDDGRLKASPKFLKATIFPYDNDKTAEQVRELRDQCTTQGLIRVYSKNNNDYLDIPGWLEHQRIRKDRYEPSKLPPYDEADETSPLNQPIKLEYVSPPGEREHYERTTQHEIAAKLKANEWQPTGERISSVEVNKRLGNLYADIVAVTETATYILIEIKAYPLQPKDLGQVVGYRRELQDRVTGSIMTFLIGSGLGKLTIEEAEAASVTLLNQDLSLVAPTTQSVDLTVETTGRRSIGEGRGVKSSIVKSSKPPYIPPEKGETSISSEQAKELFDLWNSLGVIKHRKLTGDMTRAVKAASRDFSAAEISQAMKNYAHIVNDEQCYFKYRWTLKDFLKRGLEKFLDLEVALSNYRKGGGAGEQPKPKQGRRRPITYIRGSEEPGPEDSEDMPRVR